MCSLWNNLSPAHQCRLDTVLQCNQTCADCPEKRPQWASFLIPQVEVDKMLGVLVCQRCALHHHAELGEKRCILKCLKMVHEWTEEDTQILEYSGNSFVNSIYEAKRRDVGFNKYADFDDDDEEAASNHRAKFIKYKYKKRKFQDEEVYYKKMLELLLGNNRGRTDSEEEKEEDRSTTTSSLADQRRSFRRIRSIPQSSSCRNLINNDNQGAISARARIQRCASNPDNMASLESHCRPRESHCLRRSTLSSTSPAARQRQPQRQSPGASSQSPSRRRRTTMDMQQQQQQQQQGGGGRSGSGRNLGLVQSPKIDMRNRRLSAMACNPLNEGLLLPDAAANKRRNFTSYAA